MGALASYSIRSPQYVLSFRGVDITADVSHMLRSIEYIDRVDAVSGEVEVEIEDHAKRWQGPWYPSLGDRLGLQIGYRGEGLLVCGEFEVDELELDGPPDVIKLRCLATYVTASMRTANTAGYENQSLEQIAGTIATKYALQLITVPVADQGEAIFERITQRRETDLEFLMRLAREHNYDFSVRGARLVFYRRGALESAPAMVTVSRQDVERFSFRNRSRRIYIGAQVSYFDPENKQLIAQSVTQTGVPAGDTLKIVTRCENGQQALSKAEAGLHLNNIEFIEASMAGPGRSQMVAGVNVALAGWGALDGKYQVTMARHHVARATGYTTSITARRI